ncbi:major facilitator superfamily domain-containing protein [Circinella umbellata]|nr:major facilitator superfamily domain-containing protein [Circinella umbellata]
MIIKKKNSSRTVENSKSNDYYVENNNNDTRISDSNFDNQEKVSCHKEHIQQHEQNVIKETKKEDSPIIADGGCAGWLVVLGGVLIQFITIGIGISWGVMQAYYEQHVFNNDGSSVRFQLGFVSSCLFAFLNGLGAVFQILRSILGIRIVLVIGTLFLSTGLITAGFSTQIWHLYLTQGICFGTGACFMYMTFTITVPRYFYSKRNLAFGIIAAGTGIGGAIIPFIMTAVNNALGSGWTYRILGFISIIFNVIIYLVVKEPRHLQQHYTKKRNAIFDFQVLKNLDFVLWCLAATVQLAVYASPFFITPTYATFYGLSDSQGSSLVTVGNIMNFFDRIICGLLADKFGPINMNIFFSSIAALSCFLIWTFADNYGMIMTFMVIFGFEGGVYFTLMPTITVTILGIEKLPTGISIVLLCNVISIFFTNIVSAIDSNSTTSPQPFITYKMFTGVGFFFVVIIMIWIKFRINKKDFY